MVCLYYDYDTKIDAINMDNVERLEVFESAFSFNGKRNVCECLRIVFYFIGGYSIRINFTRKLVDSHELFINDRCDESMRDAVSRLLNLLGNSIRGLVLDADNNIINL